MCFPVENMPSLFNYHEQVGNLQEVREKAHQEGTFRMRDLIDSELTPMLLVKSFFDSTSS